MQSKKFFHRIKMSFPLQIKIKKYKKHFVVRFAVYQDPLWPSLTIGIITAAFLIYFPFNRQAQQTVTANYNTEALSKEI